MTLLHDINFAGSPELFARLACRGERDSGLPMRIRAFFHSWPLGTGPADPARKPLISIEASRGKYVIRAPWLSAPFVERGLPSMLCSVAIEMVMAYCRIFPPILHIHAAAVDLPAGTCLLLGGNHAGKSSLIAGLMACGRTSLGDDLVGLLPAGELFCFGLAPRLRLPLAPSRALNDFAHANRGLADSRYLFLDPAHLAIAPFGERRKIDFCVFLKRAPLEHAILRKSQASAAKLLEHWVLGPGMAQRALEFARGLDLPFYDLEYADPDEACEILTRPDILNAEVCQNEGRAMSEDDGQIDNAGQSPKVCRNAGPDKLDLPGKARRPQIAAFTPNTNDDVMAASQKERDPEDQSKKQNSSKPSERSKKQSFGESAEQCKKSNPGRRLAARRVGARKKDRAPFLSERQYRQKEGVAMLAGEDGLYLAGNEAIFFLNQLGEIIWRMLEEPLSEAEAASLLCGHFVGVSPDVIANDVARLFAGLLQNGLAVPED